MHLTTSWLDFPKFLLIGWSGLVFVALLLPFAYLIYKLLIKLLDPGPTSRQIIAAWLLAACVLVVYGDEFVIAREAQKLCVSEAGLRVYETVQVDGFINPFGSGKETIEQGFQFMEKRSGFHRWIHISKIGGEVVVKTIEHPESIYEVVTRGQGATSRCCYRNTLEIRERTTGKLKGSYYTYTIKRGWIRSISPVSGRPMSYRCTGPSAPTLHTQPAYQATDELISHVLSPRQRD
ncbi:MAG: hypothetical protein H6977_05710 [Gammaproteobacteria bacterium]|nr:hypothetical protein [Gammaproteobacteria bacterium]MCP5199485.1 hypothetical protein [Gammaproteobacteria bacterium]